MLLKQIGLTPEVIVSEVDEDAVAASQGWSAPHDLSLGLAIAKARAVHESTTGDALIIGCDSVMEHHGMAYGKPKDSVEARERLVALSGSSGFLFTGHHLISRIGDEVKETSALVSTEVCFHTLTEAEVSAYISTGEPLKVAGAYTLDSLGGPFIREIHGDASNVVGLSVPTLRLLFAELGIGWERVLETVPNRPVHDL